MRSGSERTLGEYASVTIEAAARSVDVDVATIRHWSDVGSIEIEQRGDMHLVRLDQVRQLTNSSKVGAGPVMVRFAHFSGMPSRSSPSACPSSSSTFGRRQEISPKGPPELT